MVGERWTWDWDDRCEKDLKKLPPEVSAKLLEVIGRHREGNDRPKEVKPMPGTNGLWQVSARVGGTWGRVLFERRGSECRALTAFKKKSNQTPKQYIDRAQGRRNY